MRARTKTVQRWASALSEDRNRDDRWYGTSYGDVQRWAFALREDCNMAYMATNGELVEQRWALAFSDARSRCGGRAHALSEDRNNTIDSDGDVTLPRQRCASELSEDRNWAVRMPLVRPAAQR
ncbi:hypothetical protein [Lentzea atacamensis]|uniref:hypothetical protein n=1 Tax=Lentzea atacamensis TaxID=531938 RepID=UPI000DD45DED|nr:hypothetical protein [Lentzea atacamensis]